MASELRLCLATSSENASITLKVKRDMLSWTIACEWTSRKEKTKQPELGTKHGKYLKKPDLSVDKRKFVAQAEFNDKLNASAETFLMMTLILH